MILARRLLRRIFRNLHHDETLSFFRDIPIFQGLTTRQLSRLLLSMQKRPYRTGEVLFKEGQVGKAVFIIKTGQVELTRMSKDGKVRSLGLLGAGQMFGEMALLERMERTASATMAEEGEIYLLYSATLETLMKHFPIIGVVIMRNMAIMLSSLLRKTNKELDHHLD